MSNTEPTIKTTIKQYKVADETKLPIQKYMNKVTHFGFFEHQKKLIDRIAVRCKNQHGLLLIHSMGSGKTLSTLGAWMNMRGENMDRKLVVITPPGLDSSFTGDMEGMGFTQKEIAELQLNRQLIFHNYWDIEYGLEDKGTKKMNIGIEPKVQKVKEDLKDAVLIADEAHNLVQLLKKWASQENFRALRLLLDGFDEAYKVLLLSGTPLQKEWSDLTILTSLVAGYKDKHKKTPRFPVYSEELRRKYPIGKTYDEILETTTNYMIKTLSIKDEEIGIKANQPDTWSGMFNDIYYKIKSVMNLVKSGAWWVNNSNTLARVWFLSCMLASISSPYVQASLGLIGYASMYPIDMALLEQCDDINQKSILTKVSNWLSPSWWLGIINASIIGYFGTAGLIGTTAMSILWMNYFQSDYARATKNADMAAEKFLASKNQIFGQLCLFDISKLVNDIKDYVSYFDYEDLPYYQKSQFPHKQVKIIVTNYSPIQCSLLLRQSRIHDIQDDLELEFFNRKTIPEDIVNYGGEDAFEFIKSLKIKLTQEKFVANMRVVGNLTEDNYFFTALRNSKKDVFNNQMYIPFPRYNQQGDMFSATELELYSQNVGSKFLMDTIQPWYINGWLYYKTLEYKLFMSVKEYNSQPQNKKSQELYAIIDKLREKKSQYEEMHIKNKANILDMKKINDWNIKNMNLVLSKYLFGITFCNNKYIEALKLLGEMRTQYHYLPCFYSNFDTYGFRTFSAFLSGLGYYHFVLNPEDPKEVRDEIIKYCKLPWRRYIEIQEEKKMIRGFPYFRPLAIGDVEDEPEEVRKRLGLDQRYKEDDPKSKIVPFCILIHPKIVEGISFNLSPGIVVNETIEGYGRAEQLYARVLRAIDNNEKFEYDVQDPEKEPKTTAECKVEKMFIELDNPDPQKKDINLIKPNQIFLIDDLKKIFDPTQEANWPDEVLLNLRQYPHAKITKQDYKDICDTQQKSCLLPLYYTIDKNSKITQCSKKVYMLSSSFGSYKSLQKFEKKYVGSLSRYMGGVPEEDRIYAEEGQGISLWQWDSTPIGLLTFKLKNKACDLAQIFMTSSKNKLETINPKVYNETLKNYYTMFDDEIAKELTEMASGEMASGKNKNKNIEVTIDNKTEELSEFIKNSDEKMLEYLQNQRSTLEDKLKQAKTPEQQIQVEIDNMNQMKTEFIPKPWYLTYERWQRFFWDPTYPGSWRNEELTQTTNELSFNETPDEIVNRENEKIKNEWLGLTNALRKFDDDDFCQDNQTKCNLWIQQSNEKISKEHQGDILYQPYASQCSQKDSPLMTPEQKIVYSMIQKNQDRVNTLKMTLSFQAKALAQFAVKNKRLPSSKDIYEYKGIPVHVGRVWKKIQRVLKLNKDSNEPMIKVDTDELKKYEQVYKDILAPHNIFSKMNGMFQAQALIEWIEDKQTLPNPKTEPFLYQQVTINPYEVMTQFEKAKDAKLDEDEIIALNLWSKLKSNEQRRLLALDEEQLKDKENSMKTAFQKDQQIKEYQRVNKELLEPFLKDFLNDFSNKPDLSYIVYSTYS